HRRNPAASRALPEEPPQYRGPRPDARPPARPVDDRQAVPRALDGKPDRPFRTQAPAVFRGALHRDRSPRAAAVDPSVAADEAPLDRRTGPRGRASAAQPP